MRATDIITKKRGTYAYSEDGSRTLLESTTLSAEEIKFIVRGYVDGTIPDYQIAAFLMAVYFNGMTFEETSALTESMLHSGQTINLHGYEDIGLTGPFVDKHSTGGVGDKISLPLAPIVAACGIQDPMMSGRALGHTGGTLDKLESINGYNVNMSVENFRKLIASTGFAMTGQTKEIVPADRLLYSLRDVTGTVESIPLITASILSKKVAEGADSFVFDVKCGSGAFMKNLKDAELLASSLVKTAKQMNKNAHALITDMNTPLGKKIGNFLEIEETVDCLKGQGPKDVMEETFALAAQMILLGKKAQSKEDAKKMAEQAISSGKAYELFMENVLNQGGNPKELENQLGKRRSKYKTELYAQQDGYIFIEAYKTGMAGVTLGVGRNKTTDKVCAEAGIILNKVSGDYTKKGELLMEIYGKNQECLESAKAQLQNAVSYSENECQKRSLILKTIE